MPEMFRLENGRLSDRYRIGTDTGCIVSATVVSADITCITAGSAAVNRSHYAADQRTFASVSRRTGAPFDP